MTVINYSYSLVDNPLWGHQIELSLYNGWGDAVKATVSGTASGVGKCTKDSDSFPAQALEPTNSWKAGESYFVTTATAPGAIGSCTTTWNLTLTNGAYTPAETSFNMDDIRCDNDLSGSTTVGCVVPWYAPAAFYSRSKNPSLASHVSRAQASGLPGATFDAPLSRTTNPDIIKVNRTKACGDAPSIEGKSCDEYPLASTYQGLWLGGERRTFDGCSFDLPRQTGAQGVSVCVIDAPDNNAQGGIMSAFYKNERVLDADAYRVLVVD